MGFDAETFLKQGGTGDIVGAIGGGFGVPSCMLNMAQGLMAALLPTPVLIGMRNAIAAARAQVDAILKRINAAIRDFLGISIFPDRDGIFGYFSDTSRYGLDFLSGGLLASIGSVLGAAEAIRQAYESAREAIDDILDCISEFKAFLEYSGGEATNRREELAQQSPEDYNAIVNGQLAVYLAQARIAKDYIAKADAQLANIDKIISDRVLNPELEPSLEPQPEQVESVFRLQAGPPRASTGQFVLSVDGLYYDSQTSGIIPALLELEERAERLVNSDIWKLEQDPSLGGRGVPTTGKDLQYYFNNILDPDIVDDSRALTVFYDQDELLLSLEGQKDRRVYDLSAELGELITLGESESVLDNARQTIISEAAQYSEKIKKRKKQIELAVKIPATLGKGPLYTPGNVPVNDFSYLAGSNFLMSLEQQRKIVLKQDDVTGVVLPLDVKFSEKIEKVDPIVLDHILLSNITRGTTIASPSAASSTDSQSIGVNDRIIEDDLIALYNFLTVETSRSFGTDFGVHNSSRNGVTYDAQIVGDSSAVFTKGIGIPYLKGIALPSTEDTAAISGVGTFMKLPERNEFKDFLYHREGGTFEAWVRIPDIDTPITGDAQGLYRLILANENVGLASSKPKQKDILNIDSDFGTGVVRGLIFGFTRDRRFTSNLEPSNNDVDNPVDSQVLVVAPTQSFDSSSAGFIANRNSSCNRDSWRGLTVPLSSTLEGRTLSDYISNEFCQLSLVLDPKRNEIKLYLDGNLIQSDTYKNVFGTVNDREPYKAPSVFQTNSFRYSEDFVSTSSVDDLKQGPALDTYFTPWIIGGGYTDGNPNGNFMGGEYGGKVSGLNGHIGCVRLYSKALDQSSIVNNYNATKGFFKNVRLD
jgi:hypothetical protein